MEEKEEKKESEEAEEKEEIARQEIIFAEIERLRDPGAFRLELLHQLGLITDNLERIAISNETKKASS